jgi:hypothetical protein
MLSASICLCLGWLLIGTRAHQVNITKCKADLSHYWQFDEESVGPYLPEHSFPIGKVEWDIVPTRDKNIWSFITIVTFHYDFVEEMNIWNPCHPLNFKVHIDFPEDEKIPMGLYFFSEAIKGISKVNQTRFIPSLHIVVHSGTLIVNRECSDRPVLAFYFMSCPSVDIGPVAVSSNVIPVTTYDEYQPSDQLPQTDLGLSEIVATLKNRFTDTLETPLEHSDL